LAFLVTFPEIKQAANYSVRADINPLESEICLPPPAFTKGMAN